MGFLVRVGYLISFLIREGYLFRFLFSFLFRFLFRFGVVKAKRVVVRVDIFLIIEKA